MKITIFNTQKNLHDQPDQSEEPPNGDDQVLEQGGAASKGVIPKQNRRKVSPNLSNSEEL